MNQNISIAVVDFHSFAVCYKVRRNITAVKLHTFNSLNSCVHVFRLFNCDYAVSSNLFDCIGKNFTDFRVVVCRNCSNVSNIFRTFNCAAVLFDFFNSNSNSLVNSAFYFNWSNSSSNRFQAFLNNCISQNRSSSSTVAGNIVCLRSNFFNKLSSHVFKRIF